MSSATDALQVASGRWPRLYVQLMHLKYRNKRYRRRVVTPSTDVVIEGFPRSGTSFAIRAFNSAQPQQLSVASHAHHGAHVRRAAALGIPTLVVVRHPSQCIPSHYALREEGRRDDAALPELDIQRALKKYATFHGDVVKVRDSIVMVRFEEVIDDYGLVISRLNRRFMTDFVAFDHSEDNVARVFAASGSHLSPSSARSQDNKRGKDLYHAADARLRLRAESAYQRAVLVADRHARSFA